MRKIRCLSGCRAAGDEEAALRMVDERLPGERDALRRGPIALEFVDASTDGRAERLRVTSASRRCVGGDMEVESGSSGGGS